MKYMQNNDRFQWLGEGVPHRSKILYESCSIGKLTIRIGEFVLVRNDDALDPEDVMSCYVAQLRNLFDTGDEIDPFQAQVQWFSRITELPAHAVRSLKTVGHEYEVVQDRRATWYDMIDAETIFEKCEVLFLDTDVDCEEVLSEYIDHPFPVFFCRYVFNGVSLKVVDKNKQIINKFANSKVTEKNAVTNGFIDLNSDEKVENSVTPEKRKTPQKRESLYCAIPTGSPEYPKVLIKKIDDKVLECQNGNVRIFVADPNISNVEDFTNKYLNNLKLRKHQSDENILKKPVIHNISSQNNISPEKVQVASNEIMSDDCIESEADKSIQKMSSTLRSKSCKQLFANSPRSSPRKNSNIYCTSKRKVPIDDLSRHKMVANSSDDDDDDDISESFSSKLKLENGIKCNGDLEKRPLIHSLTFHKNYVEELETDSDCEVKLQTPKSRRSCVTKKTVTPLKNKSHRKVINDGSEKSPIVSTAVENSDNYSTPKKKLKFVDVDKSNQSPLNNKLHRKVKNAGSEKSPNKYTAVENSDTCSTPKKKSNFTDIVEGFRLTRSGRRVKSVNYTETIKEIITTATPTKKKMPRFVRSKASDDSDSSNFSPEEDNSDDSSVSGVSLLDEDSPNEKKISLKKNKKASSKKNGVGARTPSSRKNVVDLSIPERMIPLRTPKNALEESRQRLHVSAVPNSLPCREEEYSDIYSFVKGCLCAQTGGCMYISGVPGTGKTATVHEVMRNLEEEKESGEVPIFTFVEVNGMWMTDPYQCYVQIFKALAGKSIAPQQAADLLEKRFTERGPKKDAVVLLVDELDRLWTRKQTVMYNIFDWPTKKNSKLIVLAIANTMDLPERMMMNRISSRLGLTRKTFQPYTFKQLQEIIMSRIQELKVFDPDAVQLVARKVAAVSGDARRALDICRFATETIKVGYTPKKSQKVLIGMEHVNLALQQMFSSPVISAIRSSSKLTKMFFEGLLSEFTRSGLEETTLLKVQQHVISTCRFEGFHLPHSTEIFRICADLAASHLILVDSFKNDLYMKIRLNVSSDDVTYALTLK